MEQVTRARESARRVTLRATAAALVLGALSASALATGDAGAATAHRPKTLVISTADSATFGTILVSGTAVYTLKASKVPCRAQCLKVWPEVLLPKGVKKAKAGPGVNAAKLGTATRGKGARQVTYGGKALFWFAEDTGPGQVNGNVTDTWGKWSVVVTAKAANASTPAAPSTTTAPSRSTTTTPSSTGATLPKATTSPTAPPTTMVTTPPTTEPTAPPTTTPTTPPTSPPTTTPTTQPVTTTTNPGSGGVGF